MDLQMPGLTGVSVSTSSLPMDRNWNHRGNSSRETMKHVEMHGQRWGKA